MMRNKTTMNNFETVKEFTDILVNCQGKVTFITAQGDRLVTDSMLSALVGFASLISVAGSMDVRFECEHPADCENLHQFMRQHKLGIYRTT